MDELRDRYHDLAFRAVEKRLQENGTVNFDELVGLALEFPMTSLQDLKQRLTTLCKRQVIAYSGLAPGKRALEIKLGHVVEWRGGTLPGFDS